MNPSPASADPELDTVTEADRELMPTDPTTGTVCAARAPAARTPSTSRRRQRVSRPSTVRDRVVDYERGGLTTLRVSVDGSFDDKVAHLETLIALAAEAGDIIASEQQTSPR